MEEEVTEWLGREKSERKGNAVGEVYPKAQEQLCWNHQMLNVMDAVSKKEQVQAKRHLNVMMYSESREQALEERKKFEQAFATTQGGQDSGGELGSADCHYGFPVSTGST